MPALLSDLTTLRLGGPAQRVVTAATADELVSIVGAADAAGEPVLIVGGGSNLVVGDDGWPGVAVLVRNEELAVEHGDDHVLVTAGAGTVWDELVARTVREGWSGLAAMSGIPGMVGATPVQNVGAYGSEIADVLESLAVYDRELRSVETWPAQRCGFGFRTSAFKHTDRYLVLSVTLRLRVTEVAPPIRYAELARRLGVEPGATAPSAQVRDTVLQLRSSKGMVLDADDPDTWSVGSFFVNPFVPPELVPEGCPHWQVDDQVKLPAGWLIENAGFDKGYGRGRVSISTKHTLALTNRGGATTADLLALAAEVRDGVRDRFGVTLVNEPVLVGCSL